MEILNRKAKYDYFIEDEYECGIELLGNEVKSIRQGTCNIKDSYAIIRKNEVYVINMFIKTLKTPKIKLVPHSVKVGVVYGLAIIKV